MTIEKLTPIFRDVFENEEIDINLETKASDIEEWDSINHIYLIVEIEKIFKIKFTTLQIQKWENVNDIITDIDKLVNAI